VRPLPWSPPRSRWNRSAPPVKPRLPPTQSILIAGAVNRKAPARPRRLDILSHEDAQDQQDFFRIIDILMAMLALPGARAECFPAVGAGRAALNRCRILCDLGGVRHGAILPRPSVLSSQSKSGKDGPSARTDRSKTRTDSMSFATLMIAQRSYPGPRPGPTWNLTLIPSEDRASGRQRTVLGQV
jgi:hypothetical protein